MQLEVDMFLYFLFPKLHQAWSPVEVLLAHCHLGLINTKSGHVSNHERTLRFKSILKLISASLNLVSQRWHLGGSAAACLHQVPAAKAHCH